MKATAEQRAAWKAVTTPPLHMEMVMAAQLLARAWADEHPHDDEELATWDWLRHVMGWNAHSGYLFTGFDRELRACLMARGVVSIYVENRGVVIELAHNPTRRQVRLLVEALGAGE